MPQALSAVYIHVVFSTKERRPSVADAEFRPEFHAYLAEVSNTLDCPSLRTGGVEDHVHMLCRLGRTISQSAWVKELKRVSSLWLKEKGLSFGDFAWQGGYAVFSVSQSNVDAVKDYIARQEEHHRKMTFQDELRALCEKHQVGLDERYVWD
jgi:putative transposase